MNVCVRSCAREHVCHIPRSCASGCEGVNSLPQSRALMCGDVACGWALSKTVFIQVKIPGAAACSVIAVLDISLSFSLWRLAHAFHSS